MFSARRLGRSFSFLTLYIYYSKILKIFQIMGTIRTYKAAVLYVILIRWIMRSAYILRIRLYVVDDKFLRYFLYIYYTKLMLVSCENLIFIEICGGITPFPTPKSASARRLHPLNVIGIFLLIR